jgi:hypothetical protein
MATAGDFAINPDQVVVDMLDEIYQYDKGMNPVLLVVTGPKRRANQVRTANAPTVQHLEDDVVPEWDTTTASATSGATTISVANADRHRAGDLLRNPRTNETVRVIDTNETLGTIQVSRAWGGSATAMNNGDTLINIGAAEMEGDVAPPAKTTVTVTKSNYTQIVRTPVHVTKTAENTRLYGGNERRRQRRKAGEKHARIWEQICLHGVKKLDVTTAQGAIRSCGGLDEHIITNALAAGGTLTEAEFIDFIGDVNRFSVRPGNRRKLLIASRELTATISSWGSNKLQTNSGARQEYGIEVATYISPFGILDVINHPLLENGYAGYGYLLDLDGIIWRPARGTEFHANIQLPSEDAFKDEWLTEGSFTFAQEKCFGKITGVTF